MKLKLIENPRGWIGSLRIVERRGEEFVVAFDAKTRDGTYVYDRTLLTAGQLEIMTGHKESP